MGKMGNKGAVNTSRKQDGETGLSDGRAYHDWTISNARQQNGNAPISRRGDIFHPPLDALSQTIDKRIDICLISNGISCADDWEKGFRQSDALIDCGYLVLIIGQYAHQGDFDSVGG